MKYSSLFSDSVWRNAFIRDLSVTNFLSAITISATTINVCGGLYNVANAITEISGRINNISTGATSIINPTISGNLNPTSTLSSDLGSESMTYKTAYIQDICATNISVSGNINVS